MKSIFLSLLLCAALMVNAQRKASDIIGKYLSESGKAKIEVIDIGGKYYGKIFWLREPNNQDGTPKVDKNNPDQSKRKNHLIGLLLLKSMEFDGKSTWHNGTIYDPENGKDYSCKITIDDKSNLDIRGFIGVSLIGRTTKWKRVTE